MNLAAITFPCDMAPDGRILTLVDNVDIGGSELGRELGVQSTWLGEDYGPGE